MRSTASCSLPKWAKARCRSRTASKPALAGGSEYFLIEQDDCYGRDPFDSLKISHDNLVKLGFGDWFEV